MPAGPDDFHALIERLQPVRDRAVDDKSTIAGIYSFANPTHDARITTLSKFVNVLNSVQLSFTFISKSLLYKGWWDAVARTSIPDSDKRIYANEFANFAKVGFVHGMFSAIESSLRILLRALDSAACNNGMAKFKSIYECLFNSKLASPPSDGIDLLDVLRNVRNTIHNNGVYFNPRGTSSTVNWRGTTFHFTQGKPVDFVTWGFMIDVSDDLRVLLREILEDANLRAINVGIDDPFSH